MMSGNFEHVSLSQSPWNVIQKSDGQMIKLSESRKNMARYLTQPVVQLLAKTPIKPDTISWLGFLVTLGAATLVVTGHVFAAGFVVLFAGFFDILDGALARNTNRVTRFGGVLDSTLDRLAEAAMLFSILVMYAREQAIIGILIACLTLIG
ncbi:MAG: CDP-alcohol phosphatidyltransferase family protein, partial [Dehalococcoidales bacterium]|nr:CDP-alcohol phosphatidyltransferase family protein [Dehalococcoidales bacterium]